MKYKVYAGYYEIYVSQSELSKPRVLQFESDDADKVLDYLEDIDDTVLVEDSIADEIPNYNFRFEIKNGNIELVDYESEV
jgi:hypothetical protein